MVGFCKITEEIVMQILSRTPPKSLMRFKCIHKSWYSMINDPQFAAKHLHFYKNASSSTAFLVKRPVILRSETSNENVVLSYLRLETYGNGDDEDLHFGVEDLIFPSCKGLKARGQFIELPGRDDSVYIISHCDGIIFLTLYTGNLFLYNPAIKEFKIIPASCCHDCFWSMVGFGYDLKCKDYIILEIASYGETNYDDPRRLIVDPPKAGVYTLGIDSWREIKTDHLQTEDTYFWPTAFDLYSKGIFYWFGYEEKKEFLDDMERCEETNKQVMILYDTGDGLFHIAMLPDSFNEPACGVHDIHVALFNKSIALYGFSIFESIHSIQIWVTDDIRGVEESWTKYLSLEPVDAVRRSLAFWKMDEVLMIAKDGRVVLYNLLTGKLKYFPIHGLHLGDDIQGIVCVDSIVSVEGKQ
ncbi:F-box/kelch-repeat protein [Rosa sericea]